MFRLLEQYSDITDQFLVGFLRRFVAEKKFLNMTLISLSKKTDKNLTIWDSNAPYQSVHKRS
jgi:hypothetical protein